MKSAKLTAFLSCSFSPKDKAVNDYLRAIAEGLDVSCTNVATGYARTPPEQALEMIKQSDVVIAIACRRIKVEGTDEFLMPEAVSNELSFAFGQGKPLLLIRESKVRTDGFLNNYGTALQFDRDDIGKPEFLQKAITAIHNLKLGALSEHELILSQEITEFFAERASHLYELEREGEEFCWQHSVDRKITFTRTSNSPIKLSRWNDFIPDSPGGHDLPPIKTTFEINNSSRPFEVSIEYDESSPVGVNANVRLTPTPVAGDWIDYFVSFRGRYMCVVHSDDIRNELIVQRDGRTYNAYDGILQINRAKEMEIQFRFPRDYRLSPSDAMFFVASFSRGIDYIVESEIVRADVKKETIGGKLVISAKISSPLLRHVYGVAWIAPQRQS